MNSVHLSVHFLMMVIEQVSATDLSSKLTWLFIQEDFITLAVRDVME